MYRTEGLGMRLTVPTLLTVYCCRQVNLESISHQWYFVHIFFTYLNLSGSHFILSSGQYFATVCCSIWPMDMFSSGCRNILGIHMRIMCLTPSTWKVWSDEMAKLEVLSRRRCAVLRPLSRSRITEVNCSGADVQLISCHRYLVVFHPFVKQLTVFHTSGLVLPSSSILRVLNLDLHRVSGMCQRGT